jgi:hypothetical protein
LIQEAVIGYIESEKPYLNPDFNMSILSEKTGYLHTPVNRSVDTMLG